MEAATLKRKKTSVSKSKIKKTIKNVICRPDPVFWPIANDEEALKLQTCLNSHRVHIPTYTKLPWKELKLIPKNERPKPPTIKKVDGLIFGISECSVAVQNKTCSSLLVEAAINPQIIVQPIIEACSRSNIPVLCLKDLRILCEKNFGIPTSCLGIKPNYLLELTSQIIEISQSKVALTNEDKISNSELNIKDVDMMDLKKDNSPSVMDYNDQPCPYLYRPNKKIRVFIPQNMISPTNDKKDFEGQNFIKVSDESNKNKSDSKAYMKMILKKISNNPNRVKIKQQ